jgi:large subunit ribosomal protein L3
MITTVFGIKMGQTREFTENGTQIPVTHIFVEPSTVVGVETKENGSVSYKIAFGSLKHITKAIEGIVKKAGADIKPRFFRLINSKEAVAEVTVGSTLNAETVLAAGDNIKITGISRGKGFAGVVKRHGFHGGPKTHGQSDRWRSPGAISTGTTPGRVFKGKRMAGRMGSDQVTISGLKVVSVNTEKHVVTVKGLVPGARNGLVKIVKEG